MTYTMYAAPKHFHQQQNKQQFFQTASHLFYVLEVVVDAITNS